MNLRALGRELFRAAAMLAITVAVLALLRSFGEMWIIRLRIYLTKDEVEHLCTAPAAIAMKGAMVVAISCAARALRAVRRGDATSLRPIAAVGGAAFLAAAIATWMRVTAARALVIATITGPPSAPQEKSGTPLWVLSQSLHEEAWTVAFAGAALLVLVVLWGLTGVVWARGRGARGPLTALIAGASAIAAISAAGMVRSAAAAITYTEGCGGYPDILRVRYEAFGEHATLLHPMRTGVIVAALLGTAALWVSAQRSGEERPSRTSPAAAAALFAAGLAAFVLTRGMAADTRHPLPMWEPLSTMYGLDRNLDLPVAGDGPCDYAEAPYLVAGRDGNYWLDGVRLATPEEATKVLSSKRELWKQVQPKKRFPGVLQVGMPAETPIARAHVFAEIMKNADYEHLQAMALQPPRRWATSTLGEIAYVPRVCVVPIDLDRDLPHEGTWGQLVQARMR